jgi:hypothetical protein
MSIRSASSEDATVYSESTFVQRIRETPSVRVRSWDRTRPETAPGGSTDYFRYVDTRIRRIEAGGAENSRVRLSGPRRLIKDVLDVIGRVDIVYPLIAEDGEGGVFAEWKAGPQRIEIVVDVDGMAHVSVAADGETEFFVEFDPSLPLPFDTKQYLRRQLNLHSAIVRVVNPHWRSSFVG